MSGLKPYRNFTPHKCEVHGELKDNFCVAKDCMSDLCRLCLRFHNEMHEEQATNPMIEVLENVISVSNEKLTRMMWGYQTELKKLERSRIQRENEWEEAANEIRHKIQKSKAVVIEEVLDPYFNEVEQQLLQQYIFPAKKHALDSLDTPIQHLRFKIDKLEQVRKYLTRDRKEKEFIKHVFYKDDGFILENLALKIEQIIARELKAVPDAGKVEITYERDNLDGVYSALQNFVSYSVNLKDLIHDHSVMNFTGMEDTANDEHFDGSLLQQAPQIREENHHGSLNGSLNYKQEPRTPPVPYQDTGHSFQRATSPQVATIFGGDRVSSSRPVSRFQSFDIQSRQVIEQQQNVNSEFREKSSSSHFESRGRTLDELPIDSENFFYDDALTKILHFFEPRTNHFYYVDLITLNVNSPNRQVTFEKCDLNPDFLIPRHHRSLALSDGSVMLLGGLGDTPTSESGSPPELSFLKEVYIMDFSDFSMIKIDSMNYPRAAHSVIQTPYGILVAGGISTGSVVTATCEWYDFKENSWSLVANMNVATMNSTLCLLKDQYVVKFGGKLDEIHLTNVVEIYDFQGDFWQVVETKISLPVLPSLACAFESSGGKIFLFGGTYKKYSEKTDEILVIQFGKDNKIENYARSSFGLPEKDAFSNQQAIALNNRLFVLQNVTNPENKESIYQNQKRLVVIEREQCFSLN
jgi:hypothetical protein